MKKLLIVLGIVAAVVVAGLLIWPMLDGGLKEDSANDSVPETTNGQTNQNQNNGATNGDPNQSTSNEEVAATVVYTGTAFEPSQVTVKSGSLVRFVNESDRNAQISSDDHPTHKKNSELNLATLGPGESKDVKLGNPGSWGIHDHLNPSVVGKIVVQ